MKKLITGLGNPQDQYKSTRHNAGFLIIDNILNSCDIKAVFKQKFQADIAEYDKILFAKPKGSMNNSGISVQALASFYKIDNEDIVIIHDDADLSFGEYKIQFSAGSAGHHGVESIIKYLSTQDFWRVRIGIGRREQGIYDIEHWVLSDFTGDELETIKNISFEVKSKFNIN